MSALHIARIRLVIAELVRAETTILTAAITACCLVLLFAVAIVGLN